MTFVNLGIRLYAVAIPAMVLGVFSDGKPRTRQQIMVGDGGVGNTEYLKVSDAINRLKKGGMLREVNPDAPIVCREYTITIQGRECLGDFERDLASIAEYFGHVKLEGVRK